MPLKRTSTVNWVERKRIQEERNYTGKLCRNDVITADPETKAKPGLQRFVDRFNKFVKLQELNT